MKPEELLDPFYQFFRDEPSSDWTLANLPAIRARIHATFPGAGEGRGEQRWIPATSGDARVRVCLYRPDLDASKDPIPAVLYVHGGGFVLGAPEMADEYLTRLAEELGALIVAVDYRLAPEHPFPTPLEDCFAALSWLFSETDSLGLEANRMVVMGHSAGGGLAAALALLARDRQLPALAGLALIYPMLDHRTGTPDAPHENPTTGTFSWSREANQFSWACMRGGLAVPDDQTPLYSPALAPSLEGLPPSFVSVGALDLFLEEDVNFALTLSKSGVPVELHVYPGVPHMFDLHPGDLSDQCNADLVRALRNMCGRLPVSPADAK